MNPAEKVNMSIEIRMLGPVSDGMQKIATSSDAGWVDTIGKR
jgi:hypothetical protein